MAGDILTIVSYSEFCLSIFFLAYQGSCCFKSTKVPYCSFSTYAKHRIFTQRTNTVWVKAHNILSNDPLLKTSIQKQSSTLWDVRMKTVLCRAARMGNLWNILYIMVHYHTNNMYIFIHCNVLRNVPSVLFLYLNIQR